ncbi:MAG: BRCT domain-containing protein [Thermoguttaceae bacterium]
MADKDLTDRELLETGFGKKQIFVRDVNLLFGFCFGFIADAEIREEEKEFLTKWRYEHADDADSPLLRPVFAGIDAALADSVLTLQNVFGIIAILSEVQDRAEYYSTETINTQLIIAFCQGITCDGVVNKKELDLLSIWLEKFGEGTSEKWNALKEDVRALLGKEDFSPEEADRIRRLILEYISVPDGASEPVEISGKTFVLSGQFALGDKKKVGARIEALGGRVASGVSKKVDYVVVGGARSHLWKYGAYGAKIEKAAELQSEGVPIKIVSEEDLVKAIGEDAAPCAGMLF